MLATTVTAKYCYPYCNADYTTGLIAPPVALSSANWASPTSTDTVLTASKEFFIDYTKRKCFGGKYCYDCLNYKFPGYGPQATTALNRGSRGKVRIIELNTTNYGFAITTNTKMVV